MDSRKKVKPGENTFRNTGKTPGAATPGTRNEKKTVRQVKPTTHSFSKPQSYHVPSPNLKYNPPNPSKPPKRKITQHPARITPTDRLFLYSPEKELFTTAEVADIFEVSTTTVRKAIKDRYIFAYREGLYYQIPRKEVERMIIQKYWE